MDSSQVCGTCSFRQSCLFVATVGRRYERARRRRVLYFPFLPLHTNPSLSFSSVVVVVVVAGDRCSRRPLPSPSPTVELVGRPVDGNDGRRPVSLLDDARLAADGRRTVAAVDPERRRGRFGRQPPAARGDYGGRAARQFPRRRAPDERQRRAAPAGRRR